MHVAAHTKEKDKKINTGLLLHRTTVLLRLCCVAEMFENLVT